MFKTSWPSIVMFGMLEIYILARGAIQGHHGPLILTFFFLSFKFQVSL